MPTYTFLNKETGKSWDQMMSISESEKFLKDNPNIHKVPTAINMVRSVMGQKSMRNDQGWKENMSKRISKIHSHKQRIETIQKDHNIPMEILIDCCFNPNIKFLLPKLISG